MADVQLTAKQQRFCDEYLIDLNATQAAIRSGYSEKTAYSQGQRLLKNVEVKAYLDKRMAEKEDALVAKQDEIMKYLTAVMRREMSENIVVTLKEKKTFYAPDAEGKMRKNTIETEVPEVVEIPAQLKDSNKAAELLGRRYSMFTDKVDVDGALPVVIAGDDALED